MLLATFLAPQPVAVFAAPFLAPALLASPVSVASPPATATVPPVMALLVASLSLIHFWTSSSDLVALVAAAAFFGFSAFFFLMIRRPPRSTLFPYTTLIL